MQYDLWHYQVQLRRIAAHREKGVEAEIRKAYQDVLIELQAILGKYYAGYGDPETSILTRGDLQAAGQYKNFLEDVLSHLDGLGEPMERKIRKTVEDTYTTCYTGMAAAVQQVTAGNATLQSLFGGALAVTPETVRHIVEYPIPKLTLSTVFQRRRKQIVSDIQKTLAVGLASGDSYTKMAGRIAKTLGGNEKKARTIVRTEANRAISRGFQDVAEETADLLDGTGYVDVKTWRSTLDGDVRDTHRHLNGKTVHALEQFESKSGAKADCPGHFGVAEEDINCRCILVYSIMSEEEFVAQGGTLPKKSPKKEGQLQLITESDGTFRIKKADSGLTPVHQGGIIEEKRNAALEQQRYGRNKNTVVNKTYIGSGEYRRKFDNITDNKKVNKTLYNCAKKALKHRSGTACEDMYWIDSDTGKIIADEITGNYERKIKYSSKTKKIVDSYKKERLITIHTHPSSMPPSVGDLNSCNRNSYKLGIIACHDGKVFAYTSKKYINENLYNMYISSFISEGFSEYESQLKALDELMKNHDVSYWEVK